MNHTISIFTHIHRKQNFTSYAVLIKSKSVLCSLNCCSDTKPPRQNFVGAKFYCLQVLANGI